MSGRLNSKIGIQPSGGVDFFADQSMGGNRITNAADPVLAQDYATKAYTDAVAGGLSPKTGVQTATSAILPNTPAYNNGAAGIGATLTSSTNAVFPAINGLTLGLNGRILVKAEAAPGNNGIYQLSTVGIAGGGGTPWVLTRTTDADTPAELPEGTSVYIIGAASTLSGSSWVLTSLVTAINADAINFTQGASGFSAASPLADATTAVVGVDPGGSRGDHVHPLNLTGPITSVGQATSIASQTGTGSKFVMDNSPTIITPTFSGTAVGNISGNAGTVTGLAVTAGKTLTSANTLNISGTDGKGLVLTTGLTVTTNDGTLAFTGVAKTLTVPLDASVSGTNTGDQTNITGNAGTVTGLVVTAGKTLTVSESMTLAASSGGKTLTLTNNGSVEGTNTGDQTSVSGNAGTVTGLTLTGAGLTVTTNAGTIAFTGASKTLTVPLDASVSGTNTGDQTAIPNATLASMAANTVKVNATSGAATPTDLALTASTMLGRKSTGDIVALAGSDVSTILGLGTAATTAATDYATSAQGTTANNALPKAGGTMTGTITMSNSGTIAMGASKITGMAAGTAATDATNASQSAPAIVAFGDSNITGVTNGQVIYWTPWYGQGLGPSTTQSTLLMPFAGKLGPLYVYVATANAASAYTFSVCQNSTTPSSLACTVNAAANTGSDTNAAHYITVAAGDRISIQSTAPGTAQTMFGVQIALSLTVA